jgi:hypothetical protein
VNENQVSHPALKAAASIVSATFAGFTATEWAALLAAALNFLLIVDWVWKRIGKPFAQRRGWARGRPRDFMDSTGRGEP